MKRILAALFAGALFGIGLVVGRMTDPNVVIGFLDVAGDFDPTLLFVMLGAVATTTVAFRFVFKRDRPVFDEAFHVPTRRLLDRNLVIGAAIFGIGWGLSGYCPGPVLVGAAGGAWTALVFVPAMLVGAWLQRLLQPPAA
jgi:uncharacterized membrane protein YedE/YeeE